MYTNVTKCCKAKGRQQYTYTNKSSVNTAFDFPQALALARDFPGARERFAWSSTQRVIASVPCESVVACNDFGKLEHDSNDGIGVHAFL